MAGLHIHLHIHDERKKDSGHDEIIQKLNQIMTKQERFDAILDGLNTVTNEIASDYEALLAEIKNGTVSDESLAKGEANVARLKLTAASNDAPVPGTEIPPATETTA